MPRTPTRSVRRLEKPLIDRSTRSHTISTNLIVDGSPSRARIPASLHEGPLMGQINRPDMAVRQPSPRLFRRVPASSLPEESVLPPSPRRPSTRLRYDEPNTSTGSRARRPCRCGRVCDAVERRLDHRIPMTARPRPYRGRPVTAAALEPSPRTGRRPESLRSAALSVSRSAGGA